jgi:hypothetical protein
VCRRIDPANLRATHLRPSPRFGETGAARSAPDEGARAAAPTFVPTSSAIYSNDGDQCPRWSRALRLVEVCPSWRKEEMTSGPRMSLRWREGLYQGYFGTYENTDVCRWATGRWNRTKWHFSRPT